MTSSSECAHGANALVCPSCFEKDRAVAEEMGKLAAERDEAVRKAEHLRTVLAMMLVAYEADAGPPPPERRGLVASVQRIVGARP